MAAAYPLRWCVRAGGRGFAPILPSAAASVRALPASAAAPVAARRAISSSATRRAPKDDEAKGSGKPDPWQAYVEEAELLERTRINSLHDAVMLATTAEERAKAGYDEEQGKKTSDAVSRVRKGFSKVTRAYGHFQPKKADFWNEDEEDTDYVVNEEGSDDFQEDDMLPMAHAKLEEHREMREYARIAIWEMPLLSKLAKPFEPPTAEQPLRWRYTSYMGEYHPAEKKVVVEFCPDDLDLTDVQRAKLTKLAGARYNPEKGAIKMSCESFEHPAQNKRYLSDLVAKLIAAAKDPTDTFEDIPLDTRHWTFKTKPRFPKEWRMTEERQQQLTQIREQAYQLDISKRTDGALVDGRAKIKEALAPPPSSDEASLEQKLSELVAVNVSRGPQSASRRR